jgi:hypothetical protein
MLNTLSGIQFTVQWVSNDARHSKSKAFDTVICIVLLLGMV